MTFAATPNAISYTGAQPVFIDSDETGNMDPELLAVAFRELSSVRDRIKLVLPVDLLGKVARHEAIAAVAAQYGTPILSDAAESLGAIRNHRPAASFGHAAAVSFNGNKIITTSGGGALLTDDIEFAARVRHLASQARQPQLHYEHLEVGYNYRLSNILAAIGRAQLVRLDEMLHNRQLNRRRYSELFSQISATSILGEPSTIPSDGTTDNAWLTSVVINPRSSRFSRDELIASLALSNIESRPLWKPMHTQPAFARYRAFTNGTSEYLFNAGVSLPSGSNLSDGEFQRISSVVTQLASRETPK